MSNGMFGGHHGHVDLVLELVGSGKIAPDQAARELRDVAVQGFRLVRRAACEAKRLEAHSERRPENVRRRPENVRLYDPETRQFLSDVQAKAALLHASRSRGRERRLVAASFVLGLGLGVLLAWRFLSQT